MLLLVKNSVAVSDTANEHNTVVDTKDSQPMINKASNLHYIYKDDLIIGRNKYINPFLLLVLLYVI